MYAPHLDSGVEKIMVWYSFGGGRWTWGAWAKIARGTQQVQVQRGVGSSYFALSSWPCTTQVCDLIKDKKNLATGVFMFCAKIGFPLQIMQFFIGFSILLFTSKPNQHFVNGPFQTFSPILKWRNPDFVWKNLIFCKSRRRKKKRKGKYVFWTEVVAGR